MKLIAEYKRWSPWDGLLTTTPIETYIREVEEKYDPFAFSILVDPLWGGSTNDLLRARMATGKPLLAKGLDPDFDGIAGIFAGAWVLAMEPCGGDERRLVECRSMTQIDAAVKAGHGMVLLNRRDLRTGELTELEPGMPDGEFMRLAKHRHPDLEIVAASGYRSVEEAPAAADYVLIGTALLAEQGGDQ